MTYLILRAVLRRFYFWHRVQIVGALTFLVGAFLYIQVEMFTHRAGALMWFIPFRIHPDATRVAFTWTSCILLLLGVVSILVGIAYDQTHQDHLESDLKRHERLKGLEVTR